MARLGTAPAASRYDGIGVGPSMAYLFETQVGIPVDGTNALLRDLSPFVVRLVPPDALLDVASNGDINLITAAGLGASTTGTSSSIATALRTVTAVGTSSSPTNQLASFVAGGQFFTDADATFASALSDAFTAADIALQVQRILDAEPLVLLVNPTDMSTQHTKIQSYQSRTRTGVVFEAWGEDQVTISFSGTTAGFVAGASGTEDGRTTSASGYQAASRRDSAAWQNFSSLYHFYRNNGYIYDTIGRSEAHLFVGSVAIDFDQWTYQGHIESFSYRFEEGSPHKVTFELEFKASRVYDRAASTSVVLPQGLAGASSNALSFSQNLATASSATQPDFAQPVVDNTVLRRF